MESRTTIAMGRSIREAKGLGIQAQLRSDHCGAEPPRAESKDALERFGFPLEPRSALLGTGRALEAGGAEVTVASELHPTRPPTTNESATTLALLAWTEQSIMTTPGGSILGPFDNHAKE